MTISKKLLMIATLGIATQNCVQAYDVVGLKDEVKRIENYIQLLQAPYPYGYCTISHEHRILAPWLKNKLYHTFITNSNEIITIANAITKNDTETLYQIRRTDQQFNENVYKLGNVALCALYAGMILTAIRSDFNHMLDLRENALYVKILSDIEQQDKISQQAKSTKTFCDNILTACGQ
jgi:hypothetical protein